MIRISHKPPCCEEPGQKKKRRRDPPQRGDRYKNKHFTLSRLPLSLLILTENFEGVKQIWKRISPQTAWCVITDSTPSRPHKHQQNCGVLSVLGVSQPSADITLAEKKLVRGIPGVDRRFHRHCARPSITNRSDEACRDQAYQCDRPTMLDSAGIQQKSAREKREPVIAWAVPDCLRNGQAQYGSGLLTSGANDQHR